MQGGGVNDSESWSQSAPFSAAAARAALIRLENRLAPAERVLRQAVIAKARNFIARCEANGGITTPPQLIRPFLVPSDRTSRRVDIEVHTGQAFIPSLPQAPGP
jgi:hypothetical protein